MTRREWNRLMKCIEVARHFCRPGKPLQLREIDRKLGYRAGTASKLLKRARELGLLMAREELPMPWDQDLGRALARKYAPCRFIAVETHHPLFHPSTKVLGPEEEDDLLHRKLGGVAALHLAGELRHLSAIGLGAGRPLLQAGKELAHYPAARDFKGEMLIIPLHGYHDRRIWRDADLHPRQATDALRVGSGLAGAIPGSVQLSILEPLIQSSPAGARAALANGARCISRSAWKARPPQLVLVGMGVMGGGHALQSLTVPQRRHLASRRRRTRPIHKELGRIREICTAFHRERGYFPVSDVCDRLFWVPEPSEASYAVQREARQLLKIINAHILGVETGLPGESLRIKGLRSHPAFASLDQAGKIVVVAGGELKMRGLAKLLDHRRDRGTGRRFMDLLIVDQSTARMLLEHRKPLPRVRGGIRAGHHGPAAPAPAS